MTPLVYVYAVLDAARGEWGAVSLELPSGIEALPVRLLAAGPLAAAVSDVPSAEFDEAPLNAHVRDLAWLGPRALAHQQVNAALLESAEALLPLAFGAVFRAKEGVRAFLDRERGELLERLQHVRGRGEWVVAVRRDEAAALADLERSEPALASLIDTASASAPGRAYLLRKRVEEARARRSASVMPSPSPSRAGRRAGGRERDDRAARGADRRSRAATRPAHPRRDIRRTACVTKGERGTRSMPVERAPGGTSLIDVLDRILDKGIVIDAWVRVSLVGIDLITVEARIVVASIDTYLRYAEAMGITAPVARPPVGTAIRDELAPGEELSASVTPEGETTITRTRARPRP